MEFPSSESHGPDFDGSLFLRAEQHLHEEIQKLYADDVRISDFRKRIVAQSDPEDLCFEYRKKLLVGVLYESEVTIEDTIVYDLLPIKGMVTELALFRMDAEERVALYVSTIRAKMTELTDAAERILRDPVKAETQEYRLIRLHEKIERLAAKESEVLSQERGE